VPLRRFLSVHQVTTAYQKGWATLRNGDLIRAAEAEFDLIITPDKNWKYQQKVTGRRVAILVLPTNAWPKLRPRVEEIVAAIKQITPGEYREIL
jgi:hypothetical protein